VRNRILTACENGFVYLWARGKAVSRMKVHDGAVRCLGVLPGTSLVVTGGMDGRVGLVEVEEKGVVVRN
jgi:WD40 repeat protein